MKWIKTAIGAVIAISVVPLVVLSAINIKKSLETDEITVTTGIHYVDSSDKYEFLFAYPYLKWSDYLNNGYTITLLYDHTHDINITITNWEFVSPDRPKFTDNNGVSYEFWTDPVYEYKAYVYIDKAYDTVYSVNTKDINLIDITFTRTIEKNNLLTILISFIPLIFAGGVVLFFYKPFKKE